MASFNDKVREILAGLDGDDDFVQAVKDQINYQEVVLEALQDEGIKRVLKKAVADALKTLFENDNGDDDSLETAFKENVNFGELVQEALRDEGVHQALRNSVVDELKRTIEDNDDWFSEALTETIQEQLDVKEMAGKLLKEAGQLRDKLTNLVREQVADQISNFEVDSDDVLGAVNLSAEAEALVKSRDPKVLEALGGLMVRDLESLQELSEDQRQSVWEGLEVSALLGTLLSDHEFKSRLDEELRKLVDNEVENLGQNQAEKIAQSILDSQTFQSAVEQVVADIGRSGRVEEFARGVVERALRESRQLESVVFEQVQQALAAKVAAGLVQTAFGNGR